MTYGFLPYWYVCNFCDTEYLQTSKPKICKVCGRKDFRVITGKWRQGSGRLKPIVLDPHTEK